MANKDLIHYQRSGYILYYALQYAKKLTKPGASLLEIAEKIERFIKKNNAQPAFPVNISINEIAAHYSPIINDDSVIPDKSIVKIDAGVSLNGYLSDAARTFVFDEKWKHMAEAAKKAFYNALSAIKPNVSVYTIGEIIEHTVLFEGYQTVRNLSGHSLARYSLHDGISIPNFNVPVNSRDLNQKFHAGHAYAIEPFVTTGAGKVEGENETTIFRLIRNVKKANLPSEYVNVYTHIRDNFRSLPFSPRWLYNAGFTEQKIYDSLEFFMESGIVHGYEILVEVSKKPVTQFENTIYLRRSGVIVTTEPEKEK